MAYGVNPHFYNPQMGQIAQNLGVAIFGDAETRMKRDYYAAQTARQAAETGKTDEETRGIRMRNDATGSLPATLENLFTGHGTPIQNLQSNIGKAAQILTAGGGNADQLTSGLGNIFSLGYGMGDNNDKRTSLVLQGKSPDEDFAGTDAQADHVANRNAGNDRATKFGVERIQQAGANSRNAATIAGQNTRFFNAPITAKPGDEIYLSPTDPRRGKVGDDKGVVRGASTKATVQGEAGDRMLAGETSPTLDTLFSGSVRSAQAGGGAGGGKPIKVSPKDIDNIEMAALGQINGAVDRTNASHPVITEDFRQALNDPAKTASARAAAAAEYQASRNGSKAQAAYLKALGLGVGDTVERTGGVFGIGGTPTITRQQTAAPQIPAGAPTARNANGDVIFFDGKSWVAAN